MSEGLPAGPERLPVPSVAVIVLDGWGLAQDGPGNAVSQAATPIFDTLWESYPHTTLSTSGRATSASSRGTRRIASRAPRRRIS